MVDIDVSKSPNYKMLGSDFKLMINAVKAWKGTLNFVFVRKNGVKTNNKINYKLYTDLKAVWDKEIKRTGKEPADLTANVTSKPTPTPVYSSGYWGQIEKGTHQTLSNMTAMTNEVIKHCGYEFYLNGQKNLPREVKALINSFNGIDDGENCVDYAQASAKLAKEKGYGVTVYGIRCVKDGINHAVVHLTGKEFANRTCVINHETYPGVIMDWAKLASSGGNIGDHWCDMNLATKNPSWIPYE